MKLTGKVTLITNVSQFMGPACTEEFAKEGATLALHDRTEARAKPALDVTLAYGREAMVVAGERGGLARATCGSGRWSSASGGSDVLVETTSSHPRLGGLSSEIDDEAGRRPCASDPIDQLFERVPAHVSFPRSGRGKARSSSTSPRRWPSRGFPNYAAHSAARAGANGLTRAVGLKVARFGIQVNAIAQNFVENPTYFGPDVVSSPEKLARLVKHVPAGRLARSEVAAPSGRSTWPPTTPTSSAAR